MSDSLKIGFLRLFRLVVLFTGVSTWLFAAKLGPFGQNLPLVESAVTGNVIKCVRSDENLFDPESCVNRLHTNVDVFHGLREFHYIYRSKSDPSRGLYMVLRTSNTSVEYKLNYETTVPFSYKEHTEPFSHSEVGDLETACKRTENAKCTKGKDTPDTLLFFPKVCCVCNLNVKGETARGKYQCAGFNKAFNIGVGMTMSCLETIEPWYRLYMPAYPPNFHRNVVFTIYKFDSSKGIIPDVKLEDRSKLDNYDFSAKKKLDPSIKPEAEKAATETTSRASVKQTRTLNPNYRRVILDNKIKEEKIEDMDITISLLSSNTKDGSQAPLIDKYIAIPSFPRTNETVKGSSLLDKCTDATWDKSLKCPEYMKKSTCNVWRCTINMRAISKNVVDTSGTTCDKIGVSLKTWADHRNLCKSLNGSCLKNQLKWYLDQEKEKARLPKLYGVDPMLISSKIDESLPTIKNPNETTLEDKNRNHFITYTHPGDDVSRVKIDTFDATITEIISSSPGFILHTSMDKECELSSERGCNLEVKVKNMGLKQADYKLRTKCWHDLKDNSEDKVCAYADELTIGVEGNDVKTVSLPIKIMGNISKDSAVCEVRLFSATLDAIDHVTVGVKMKVPEENFGKEIKRIDPETHTVSDHKQVHVIPPNPQYQSVFESDKAAKAAKDDEPKCNCAKWNIFCMIINFKKCISSVAMKIVTYVFIALVILLVLVLLPVLIPLFVSLVKAIVNVLKMPLEAMQRRKEAMSFKKLNNDLNETKYPGEV